MENELEKTILSQTEETKCPSDAAVSTGIDSNGQPPQDNVDEISDSECMEKPGENVKITPSSEVMDGAALERKKREIQNALLEPVNKSKLRDLARSEGGFVNDNLRRQVWPVVLDIDTRLATPAPSQTELEAHAEYKQVVMDVNRSIKRFPPDTPKEQSEVLQDQLTRLIMRVIIKHPHLRYYQGYHDVAVTFLLVVGEDVAFQIMEKLSTGHFREFMEPTMDETSYLLNFVYPLIKRMNPKLYEYMERAEVGTLFCLEWPLTWYGHSLERYQDIVRLYDYFLVTPPLFPLYLAAAMVVYRQDEIFKQDCDMASIHSLLAKIPDGVPFELLLKEASSLYERYPPSSIEREVEERFHEEMRRRQPSSHPPARYQQQQRWLWPPLNRFVPPWIAFPMLALGPRMPRMRYRMLFVTATVVGFYAWMRMAEAVPIDNDSKR